MFVLSSFAMYVLPPSFYKNYVYVSDFMSVANIFPILYVMQVASKISSQQCEGTQ